MLHIYFAKEPMLHIYFAEEPMQHIYFAEEPMLHIYFAEEPMLRPVQYEILLDAPGDVYFAEQTVTGRVLLQTDQPVNLKGN